MAAVWMESGANRENILENVLADMVKPMSLFSVRRDGHGRTNCGALEEDKREGHQC